MILREFTVENLFCYRGQVAFRDLAPPPGKNIVLIRGRNNAGKTSFLRSLKLLLGGVTEELRNTTPLDRVPGHVQYVRGTGEWAGVLNTDAIRNGVTEFSVKGDFLTDEKQELTVLRRWDPASGTDTVEVTIDGVRYLPDQSADFLTDTFPAYSLAYFFFDGELVQDLAADTGEQTRQMIERILRLRPVVNIRDHVQRLSVRWAEESATPEQTNDLAQSRAAAAAARQEQKQQELTAEKLRSELAAANAELATLDDELAALRRRGSSEEHAALVARREGLRSESLGMLQEFAQQHLTYAPYWANEQNWEDVLSDAGDPSADAMRQAALTFSSRLLADLNSLDGPGPLASADLRPSQVDAIRGRIAQITADFVREYSSLPDGQGAGTATIEAQLAESRRLNTPRLLVQICEFLEQLRALEHDLLQSEQHSAADQDRLLFLQSEANHIATKVGVLTAEIRQQETEIRSNAAIAANHEDRSQQLLSEIQKKVIATSRAARAEQVSQFLSELVGAILRRRRTQLTENSTKHFHSLFSSSTSIDKVEVTDNFTLRCLTSGGREIQRASLSAGTRQLLSISVLWSLSEAATSRYPIAIDTPLARLDADHRTAMLETYFPSVADQVILLPTDAELPDRDLRKLGGHVYRHLELVTTPEHGTTVREIK